MLAFAAEIEAWKKDGGDLKTYWSPAGPGGAKIAWGTPGDFTRCHMHLNKHVGSKRAARICASWHHLYTGMWPGDRDNK